MVGGVARRRRAAASAAERAARRRAPPGRPGGVRGGFYRCRRTDARGTAAAEALGGIISLRALAAVMREDRAALVYAARALKLLPPDASAHRLHAIDAIARTHLTLGT